MLKTPTFLCGLWHLEPRPKKTAEESKVDTFRAESCRRLSVQVGQVDGDDDDDLGDDDRVVAVEKKPPKPLGSLSPE